MTDSSDWGLRTSQGPSRKHMVPSNGGNLREFNRTGLFTSGGQVKPSSSREMLASRGPKARK